MHANDKGVWGSFSVAVGLLTIQMRRADFPLYKTNVNFVALFFFFSVLTFINLTPFLFVCLWGVFCLFVFCFVFFSFPICLYMGT